MRSLFTVFFLSIFISLSTPAADKSEFAGSWDYSVSDVFAFSLDLTQSGDRIEGYHIAIARSGKRVDAILPNEDKPSITGNVASGVASISFRSGYSDATGTAKLTRKGKKLLWKITGSTGAHYLPISCVLHRVRATKKSSNHTLHLTDSAEGRLGSIQACVPPHPQVSLIR